MRNWKNVLRLLFYGILIGIFLEIILLERDRFNLGTAPGPLPIQLQITCLVLVKHGHLRHVKASKDTWLRHCDVFRIVNIQRLKDELHIENTSPCPNKAIGFREKGEQLRPDMSKREEVRNITARSGWSGLCKALLMIKYIPTQWFVIVPDSLIVLVENLKLFVANLNSNENHYYGYGIENYEANFNTLSAGILLSRGAMNKLLQKFRSEIDCDLSGKHWRNEDFYLGKYLKELGISPKDTRDEEGRGRFHGYNIKNLLWPEKLYLKSHYKRKALFPIENGFNCCSPSLVTLDVSEPDMVHKTYFFLYVLKTSEKKKAKLISSKKNKGFFWKDFLRGKGYNESAIESMTSEEYYRIWKEILPPDIMYKKMRDFAKFHEEKDQKS